MIKDFARLKLILFGIFTAEFPYSFLRNWKFGFFMWKKKILICFLVIALWIPIGEKAYAAIDISAESAILIEASTGQVIYEKNATKKRSPASITKIMTLLLAFEQIKNGKISLDDQVLVSNYAASMGGSQVFLAEGEIQNLETMLKCIAVASGNDASVAVAEHIAGSEEAFVDMMNLKAMELGMQDTHFEDCCGLTESDNHYTTARDVAIMSRALTVGYPEVFQYTKIWMEDIIHNTGRGSEIFTLSSTNKLLKQYQWATGLKTGSTRKAKYCLSATASKDGKDLIAVIMGANQPKIRFSEAQSLLTYGFQNCNLYIDENKEKLSPIVVKGGTKEEVLPVYEKEFRYLDTNGKKIDNVEKVLEIPKEIEAPIEKGEIAGYAVYLLEKTEIGRIPVLYDESVPKATFLDILKKTIAVLLF